MLEIAEVGGVCIEWTGLCHLVTSPTAPNSLLLELFGFTGAKPSSALMAVNFFKPTSLPYIDSISLKSDFDVVR